MIELKRINIHANGEALAPDEVNRFKRRLAAFIQDELNSATKPAIYLSYQEPGEQLIIKADPATGPDITAIVKIDLKRHGNIEEIVQTISNAEAIKYMGVPHITKIRVIRPNEKETMQYKNEITEPEILVIDKKKFEAARKEINSAGFKITRVSKFLGIALIQLKIQPGQTAKFEQLRESINSKYAKKTPNN